MKETTAHTPHFATRTLILFFLSLSLPYSPIGLAQAAVQNVTLSATDSSIFYYTKGDWPGSVACGKETCTRGAFASFTFTGTAIYVSLFPLTPRVNEISPVTIDLDGTHTYMAPGLPEFPTGGSCQYTWFAQEDLENAQHSIKLTYEIGPQDPAVARGCIGISRFIYTTDDSTPIVTLSTQADTSTSTPGSTPHTTRPGTTSTAITPSGSGSVVPPAKSGASPSNGAVRGLGVLAMAIMLGTIIGVVGVVLR